MTLLLHRRRVEYDMAKLRSSARGVAPRGFAESTNLYSVRDGGVDVVGTESHGLRQATIHLEDGYF